MYPEPERNRIPNAVPEIPNEYGSGSATLKVTHLKHDAHGCEEACRPIQVTQQADETGTVDGAGYYTPVYRYDIIPNNISDTDRKRHLILNVKK